MKPKPSLRPLLALTGSALLLTSQVHAITLYWDNNGGTANNWGSFQNWTTSPTTANQNPPNTSPNASDHAVFNVSTLTTAQTVNLTGARTILGMTFNNAATTTITANASATTNQTLTLGNDGITINSGAGAVTLGDGGTTGQVLLSLGAGAQTWTNLSPNDFTINNTAATFTRAAGATLTFNQVSTGGFLLSSTVLPNDATGIIGPWAFSGTGSSQRYAFNNSGTIAAYSGGTAAADVEAFTSDTTNYDFSSTGTTSLTDNRTAHTARYTGTGNTIDLGASGANTLTLNGLLAVGSSGTVSIERSGSSTGTLAIGSANDLVIAGTQDINISAPITGASGSLTFAGSGTLTLSGSNTYGGATTVGSGTLIVDGTGVLPTGTLVTVGNAAGTTFRINNNTTVGNLAGFGSLGTVALQGNTLTFGNSTSTTYNGQITGTSASGIVKQGTGTLTLGNVTMIPGTLTINAGNATFGRGILSGGTVTLGGNNAVLAMPGGTAAGPAGIVASTISNPIVIGSSVTTTGASIYTSGAGRWNFAGNITGGATSGSQTLKFNSRNGGTVGGDRTSILFSGVISDGIGGGTLNLSFDITPQTGSNASNQHPTNVSLSGVNTFTGTLTALRSNTGATSWLTIGGERWTDGNFGVNNPQYGREGTGYLAGPANDGVFTSAINFSGTANQIVNLNYFSSANQTFAGVIGGSGANGALVKEGTGTLTLSNANLYNSLTTIGGGTLLLGFGDNGNGVTNNILPSTTPLWMGLGTVYDPITANADTTISGGGGGGTLQLAGAAVSATQTVASLNVSANTANRIVVGADRTLTITSPTIAIGTNSGLNFNTVAGGNNGATVGTSVVQFGAAPTTFTNGFTVTDAGGFGLAAVNGSNQVIRDTGTTLLPASGASSATNYRIDNNAGGPTAGGSSSLAVTASQSAGSITVDTTSASGTLTLDSGVLLDNNVWNFGGSGTNTYQIIGSDAGAGVSSVASGNTISINNFNAGTVTFSSPILAFGTNALVVGGTGTVALAGTNTYTGATTINSGTLQIGGSGSLNSGAYAGAISINGGSVLKYSSSTNQTLSGVIGGPGGITKDTDASSILTLSGANIYTGPTTVNAGTLKAGAAASGRAFGGSAVTLANTSGVTLDLNNFSQTIGSLAGGGGTGGNVSLGSATLTTGGNNASTTFGGVISGIGGGLTKNGIGTMTLTGASTYTGATSVNAGTLALVGSSLTSAITVASGASLGFTLGSTSSNTSTINLTNGTVKITGTPTLSSYTLMTTGGITGTPTLDAPIPGYTLVVDGTTLKLNSTSSGTSYTAWKTANSVTGDPDEDQDGDGVSNGIEFLLGGTTGANDLDKLPITSNDGTNMTFTFKRKAGILDGIASLVIEVDTDLSGWETTYTVGATTGTSTAGVIVTPDTPSGFDTITLTVPVGSDTKKFARLRLLVNP